MKRLYHWTGGSRKTVNVGDRLGPWLMYRLDQPPALRPPEQADLVLVGSILEHLPEKWQGTICGAGFLFPDSKKDLSTATVLACRGRLTQKRLKAKDAVLGDPGLLASKFIVSMPSKFPLGVISHFSDSRLSQRFPHALQIDVAQHPDDFISQVAQCRQIISSSLHGLVIADAFGIPRQAETFENIRSEGGINKWLDYSSIFDGKPHFGEMYSPPFRTVERVQQELLEAVHEALK